MRVAHDGHSRVVLKFKNFKSLSGICAWDPCMISMHHCNHCTGRHAETHRCRTYRVGPKSWPRSATNKAPTPLQVPLSLSSDSMRVEGGLGLMSSLIDTGSSEQCRERPRSCSIYMEHSHLRAVQMLHVRHAVVSVGH